MTTKIFCDIAELDLIKKFNKKKIVKGFTTNPSLMRKAGAKDYKSYSKKILKELKSSINLKIEFRYTAGWSSLVARQAHNLKVGGSNPSPATNYLTISKLGILLYY